MVKKHIAVIFYPLITFLLAIPTFAQTSSEEKVSLLNDAKAQIEVLNLIRDRGSEEDINDLVEIALFDSDWVLRRYAVEALGKIDSPKASEALKKAVKDEEEIVRIFALLGLKEREDKEILSLFIEGCSDTKASIRLVSTKALRSFPIKSKEVATILETLLTNSHSDLEREVILILGAMKAKAQGTVPKLMPYLYRGNLGKEAAQALSQIGGPVLNYLMKDLEKGIWSRSSIEVLAKMGSSAQKATSILLKLYQKNRSEYSASTMVKALARMGSPESLPILLDVLKNGSGFHQQEAEHNIGYMGEQAAPAIPDLIQTVLKDNYNKGAQESIALIGPKALPELEKILHHEDKKVRKIIAKIIANIEGGTDLVLRSLQEKPDISILMGLSQSKNFSQIPTKDIPTSIILNSIQNDYPPFDALRLLEQIGSQGKTLIPALLEISKRPYRRNRYSEKGLKAIGESAYLYVIEKFENSQDHWEKIRIFRVLIEIGEDFPETKTFLDKVYQEHTGEIKSLAGFGLVLLGEKEKNLALDLVYVIANQETSMQEKAANAFSSFSEVPEPVIPSLLEIAQDSSPYKKNQDLALLALYHIKALKREHIGLIKKHLASRHDIIFPLLPKDEQVSYVLQKIPKLNYFEGVGLLEKLREEQTPSQELVKAYIQVFQEHRRFIFEVAYHLGELGPLAKEAIPLLLKEIDYQEEMVLALGKISKSSQVIQALIKVAHKENFQVAMSRGGSYSRPYIHKIVGEALKNIGPKAYSALLQELGKGKKAKRMALFLLGEMKDKKAIPLLIQELSNRHYGMGIDFEDRPIAEVAAEALGKIGEAAYIAIPYLARELERDGYSDEGNYSVYALGKIQHADGIPILIKAIQKSKSFLEINAQLALIAIGPKTHEALRALYTLYLTTELEQEKLKEMLKVFSEQ